MNSAVASVLPIMGNSLKAEHLMIGAGAFLVVTYSLFCLRRRNLPPLAKEGILDTVKILTAGKANPKFYLSKMKELGPVYRIRMPEMRHWVVVSDSALARKLMSEEDEKPFFIQRFNGVTNGINSVFTHRTSSHDWHSARRGATSSFSIANVNLALPWINRKTDELKKMLMDHHSAKTTFDLPKLMSHLTKDLICGAMFDRDLHTMGSAESDGRTLLIREEKVLKEYALRQMLNPFRFLMYWDKDLKEAKEAALGMEKFEQDLLSCYRSKKSPAEIEKDPSILGHLVRSPYASDVERCADMTLFVGAGSDTIAYTLAWTFLEISRNPEVYHKLKEEINAIAPGDGTITAQQVNMMTYLDCVLKESMRLWPVLAQGVPRELSKDIKYNNYVIPKGSVVLFPFIAIFRDGIEDPDLFKPDRWAPDHPSAAKMKELFFPFSLGKRNCIGQNLANLELKVVLAQVCRSFRFELVSEADHDYFLTLKPVNAHMRVYSV